MYFKISSSTIAFVCLTAVCAAPALGATHTVNQVNNTFDPSAITVQPGDTVEWIWASGSHTVTSGTPCTSDGLFDDPFTSGNPTVVFNVPANEPEGDIPYFCIPHCGGGMTGIITVEAGAAIPTVSEWGLIALALLIMSAATVIFATRKTASTA